MTTSFQNRPSHHRQSKAAASPPSDSGTPSPMTGPRTSKTPSFPSREDCWSEDATFTLIEAWGERHLSLNRGNLRQKHWEEVSEAVNAFHFVTDNPKSHRTDVQCKNRIDTLKKKYKIEKARVSESNDTYTSTWPFFSVLDSLIGSNFPKPSPPLSTYQRTRHHPALPWTVPVAPRSATIRRPAPEPPLFPAYGDESCLRQNLDFSAFAAVAAAAAAAEREDSNGSRPKFGVRGSRMRECGRECGYMELARAIERFAETYERVEVRKHRKILELERQRMQFAKDLECHRMELFMDTLWLGNIKRAKRSPSSEDNYF